ncbi:MAG TPA: hypothetical protein VFE18_18885 [Phenylobacterium sp.]|jgi:hypothetical protein|uniref:hypothetical protein n=1 Tax=Phenylobacterium sp. TaxID=1871053 RepID=UPI002D653DF2|nr:hypothetical protein [Phenylobacterium sp.]HZZ70242.1 hypothetical protein [Phenylobacterium sp.]
MPFDVRLPIGLLFLAIGLLVAGYGVMGHVPLSAGVNIDLVWGAVMAVFGAIMLVLAALARRGDLPPPPEA